MARESEVREARREVVAQAVKHFKWHKDDSCEVCVAVRAYLCIVDVEKIPQ